MGSSVDLCICKDPYIFPSYSASTNRDWFSEFLRSGDCPKHLLIEKCVHFLGDWHRQITDALDLVIISSENPKGEGSEAVRRISAKGLYKNGGVIN